ncbi:MAG: DUF5131 family protein [Candidatus Helarchaeota archaeon]
MNRSKIEWCDYSANPIRLKCQHYCKYCYMHRKFYRYGHYFKEICQEALNLKCLYAPKTKNRSIFIGSGTDIFGAWVPSSWIIKVLDKCRRLDKSNTIIFLTKNPQRYLEFKKKLSEENFILGVTIETDLSQFYGKISAAPSPRKRIDFLIDNNFNNKMLVSIEPVLKFSQNFIDDLLLINPNYIVVGANSINYIKLPEPKLDELILLIKTLKPHYELFLKENLERFYIKPHCPVLSIK